MAIEASSNQYSNTNTTASVNKNLGKDEFLKLLITQLKYQNPMEPIKDQDFIAQMANFSALEQMQNLNKSFAGLTNMVAEEIIPGITMQQASSIIGKEVIYIDTPSDENEEIKLSKGLVEAVSFLEGEIIYTVNGKNVENSALVSINNVENSLLKDIKTEIEAMKKLMTKE